MHVSLSAVALSGKSMFPALKNASGLSQSLQAPMYFRFLALVSWSWVVMNRKRVYSQENARMHFPRPE